MSRSEVTTWNIKVDGIDFKIIQDSDGKFIVPEFVKGMGSALKPAAEEWILCRKPLSEKSIAENVLKWGVGGLNIDGCRIKINDKIGSRSTGGFTSKSGIYHNNQKFEVKDVDCDSTGGRFPANVILSYTEDEYELKNDLNDIEKKKVFDWLYENS